MLHNLFSNNFRGLNSPPPSLHSFYPHDLHLTRPYQLPFQPFTSLHFPKSFSSNSILPTSILTASTAILQCSKTNFFLFYNCQLYFLKSPVSCSDITPSHLIYAFLFFIHIYASYKSPYVYAYIL
jgi:hypothetical protein